MMAKIIDFKRKVALLLHKRKQDEVVDKIIKVNLDIAKQLREWQKETKLKIGIEPYHKLPKHIQGLINQYQANDHLLMNKYNVYLPDKI